MIQTTIHCIAVNLTPKIGNGRPYGRPLPLLLCCAASGCKVDVDRYFVQHTGVLAKPRPVVYKSSEQAAVIVIQCKVKNIVDIDLVAGAGLVEGNSCVMESIEQISVIRFGELSYRSVIGFTTAFGCGKERLESRRSFDLRRK